jgi:hypothetical protein
MPSGWPRRFCCDADLALLGYDGLNAEKDLAKWHDRGPHPATEELISVIRNEGNEGARLADIGAAIGAVHGEAAFENARDGGTREWRVVLYRHA